MKFMNFQTVLKEKTIWKSISLLMYFANVVCCDLCGISMEPPSRSDMSRMIHMYLLITNKHLTHFAAISWPVIPWLFHNNSCSEAFHKIYAVVLRGQCSDNILIQIVDIYAGYYLTRHKSKLHFFLKGNWREKKVSHQSLLHVLAKFLT